MSSPDSGRDFGNLGGLLTPNQKEKISLYVRSARKVWKQFKTNRAGMIGLIILILFFAMAVFAPWLATHDNPKSIMWEQVNPVLHPPSTEFLFGTDDHGRDVYSMTVWGSRSSLIVGIIASVISMVLGTLVGVFAGYLGKLPDEILMRTTDFFLVIPWFPLMIVFAMLLGQSFTNVIIVIGITSWPSTARIVRAQVMSIKEHSFIERARAVGAGDGRIVMKHILPNVFPLIFANTILLIANAIFSESFLDFFGLGDPTIISWGTMLDWAYESGAFTSFAWWYIFAPGACIVILIMAFYLIGDALDEVLNPKLRKR
jgi:peptide/nickel transport system permease protein